MSSGPQPSLLDSHNYNKDRKWHQERKKVRNPLADQLGLSLNRQLPHPLIPNLPRKNEKWRITKTLILPLNPKKRRMDLVWGISCQMSLFKMKKEIQSR